MHTVIFPVPTKTRERRHACTYILTQLPIKSNGIGLSKAAATVAPKHIALWRQRCSSVWAPFTAGSIAKVPKTEAVPERTPRTSWGQTRRHCCFCQPKLEGGKRYCFVAIDPATRLAYLAMYKHKNDVQA